MTLGESSVAPRGPAEVSPTSRRSWSRPAGHRGRAPWVAALERLARAVVVVLVAAALLAAGLHWLYRSGILEDAAARTGAEIGHLIPWEGWTVREIVVTGRRHAGEADIAAALGARRGDPMFGVDPREARERIESLGWVRSASVQRRFPHAVLVDIVERRPFALWQRQGRVTLVDRDGEPIGSRNLERFDHLPVVVGEDALRHVGDLIAVLALQPALFDRIDSATRISGRRWDVRLRGGLTVRLPEADVAGAWNLLAALAAEYRLLERDVVAVDLRVKDRFAVRLGPASAVTRRGEGRSA